MRNRKQLDEYRQKFRLMPLEERERFQLAAIDAARKAVQSRDWEEAAWQAALSCIAEDPDGDPIQMLIDKGVITPEELEKANQASRFDAESYAEKIRSLPSKERHRLARKDLLQNARSNDPEQFAEYVTKICLAADPNKDPAQFLAEWGVMSLEEAKKFLGR